jgi:hypothetical protein
MRPVAVRELLSIRLRVRPVVDLGAGAATARYESARRPATAAVVQDNRGFGPEVPMLLVEQRAPEGFADIAAVITPDEIARLTEDYRRTAGFSLIALLQGASLMDRPY